MSVESFEQTLLHHFEQAMHALIINGSESPSHRIYQCVKLESGTACVLINNKSQPPLPISTPYEYVPIKAGCPQAFDTYTLMFKTKSKSLQILSSK